MALYVNFHSTPTQVNFTFKLEWSELNFTLYVNFHSTPTQNSFTLYVNFHSTPTQLDSTSIKIPKNFSRSSGFSLFLGRASGFRGAITGPHSIPIQFKRLIELEWS